MNSNAFAWEDRYTQSWEIVKEDSEGTLQPTLATLLRLDSDYLRRRRAADAGALRRGLMRHLVIIVDWSRSITGSASLLYRNVSVSDSLSNFIKRHLCSFASSFFEQNPLSQLAFIFVSDGLAKVVSPISSSAQAHIANLKGSMMENNEPRGDFSIQNGVEVAFPILEFSPAHGTREIILLNFGLSTIDPEDVFTLIPAMRMRQIRLSAVSYAGEISIISKLCKETGGVYHVSLDDSHFLDLFRNHIVPPIITSSTDLKSSISMSYLIQMGFPTVLESNDQGFICSCHHRNILSDKSSGENTSIDGGFTCTRCFSRVCHLPCDCPVCGFTLVAAPHLARSYHHLFPVASFEDIDRENSSPGNVSSCAGCLFKLDLADLNIKSHKEGYTTGKCTRCGSLFCLHCNQFIHETLFNCPGCFRC